MKIKDMLKNEDGSVLVIALILLILLTLMGISSTTTSTVEVKVAINENQYKQNLYQAESAADTVAQWVENQSAATLNDVTNTAFMTASSINLTNIDVTSAPWQQLSSTMPNAYYAVVESSGFVDLSAPSNLHEYKIYGVYSTASGSQSIVEMGYRRRF